MCNTPYYSFRLLLSNLFRIFRFELMVRNFQLRKMNISDTFFFMSSIEAPKLQRPPETFMPSTEKPLLRKEQPKNSLRASSKAILTRVTLRARGGYVVHLVGYGGNCPLWTAWEEPDRHCWTLLSTTSPYGGNSPAKTPGSMTEILQHDNARPHAANMTKAAIQELDWQILPHSPYSPDLTPSDYHLFRSLSLQQSARSFLQQRRWAPKLARQLLHGQTGEFLQTWVRKPAQTSGCDRK
jgi:hypothetical protein